MQSRQSKHRAKEGLSLEEYGRSKYRYIWPEDINLKGRVKSCALLAGKKDDIKWQEELTLMLHDLLEDANRLYVLAKENPQSFKVLNKKDKIFTKDEMSLLLKKLKKLENHKDLGLEKAEPYQASALSLSSMISLGMIEDKAKKPTKLKKKVHWAKEEVVKEIQEASEPRKIRQIDYTK